MCNANETRDVIRRQRMNTGGITAVALTITVQETRRMLCHQSGFHTAAILERFVPDRLSTGERNLPGQDIVWNGRENSSSSERDFDNNHDNWFDSILKEWYGEVLSKAESQLSLLPIWLECSWISACVKQ